MAGPWTDFQTAPAAGPDGPWNAFRVGVPTGTARIEDVGDAILNGLRSSSSGLILRGKAAEKAPDAETPWYHRALYGAGQVIGDLPAGVVGAIGGGAAGTAATANPIGGLVGAGAGGFAVPMAIREALMQAYNTGHAVSWADAWDIAKAGLKGFGKGAVIGGATMGAGAVVGRPIGAALAPGVGTAIAGQTASRVTGAAITGAELATMTTASAALEGHLPTAQDFMDNAILLGGMKAAVATAKGLRSIYAETGMRPEEVVDAARADPALKAELTGTVYRGTVGDDSGTAVLWFTPDKKEAKKYGERAAFSKAGIELPEDVYSIDEVNHSALRQWAKEEGVDLNNYNLVTAKLDISKPLDLRSLGTDIGDVKETWKWFYKKGLISESWKSLDEYAREEVRSDYAGKALWHFIENEGIIEAARKQGHDGVVVEDIGVDGKAHLSYGVFDQRQVVTGIPAALEPVALEQRIQAAVGADPRPELVRAALTDPNWKPTADQPPPVVTEYITDRASLAGVYGEVAKTYAKDIEAITRGTRSNKETMADAYAKVYGGKLEEHVAGMAANAETMAARLIVAKAALVDVGKAAEAVKANPLDAAAKLKFYASVELLSQLQKEARGATAEWGRAGQIQRAIKRDPSMLIDAESLLAGIERKMPINEVAKMFESLKDPANKMAFAEKYMEATTLAKVVEAWRAGLFSGPLTWEANVMGNVARWGVEVAKAPIQASLSALNRKAQGDPLNMAQFTARAFAPFHGLKLAVLDGMRLAEEGARLLQEEGVAGAKKIGEAIATEAAKNDDRIDVRQRANTGAVGKFVGFSFGMLKLQDLPFRTIGERAEAYIRAIDRASKEFDPSTQEFKEAVAKYTNDPGFGLSAEKALEATKAVEQAGAESVFAQRLGPRMEKFSSTISGTPWQFVFAAIKTPANLLDYSVQHTPGLNFLSSRWREDWKAGGERKAAAAARVIVGSAIAATAYSMAEDGLLTGGNLPDKEMGGTRTGAGIQNYSVKIGDKYYSIQRLEPVAKVAMLAADLIDIINSPKITDDDKTKAKSMLVLAFANATISTTYLSGLSALMKATLDPERYGENFVESYGSTLVPKIVGQPVAMADPYKREVDGALDSIQAQLPFLREKLIPQRDRWGELVKNEKLFSVMPIQVTEAAKEKVKTEAVRLWVGIADAPKFAEESAPLKSQDKRLKLSPEQRDVYREVSGKQAMEWLAPIVNDPDWDKMPAFVQTEIYKDILKDARKQGELRAVPPDSDQREKLRDKVRGILEKQVREAASR